MYTSAKIKATEKKEKRYDNIFTNVPALKTSIQKSVVYFLKNTTSTSTSSIVGAGTTTE